MTASSDQIVVLMFENHPFGNLLGRLNEPGEVAAFGPTTPGGARATAEPPGARGRLSG